MAQSPDLGSPLWWMLRLERKRQDNTRRLDTLNAYSTGDHPLPEGDERARELFRSFQRKARTNYCGLVASSVAERLHVDGFRSGSSGDAAADNLAWQIWQDNSLDADSELVTRSPHLLRPVLVVDNGRRHSIEDPLRRRRARPLNRRRMIAESKPG